MGNQSFKVKVPFDVGAPLLWDALSPWTLVRGHWYTPLLKTTGDLPSTMGS
jgi:hypothetical protein